MNEQFAAVLFLFMCLIPRWYVARNVRKTLRISDKIVVLTSEMAFKASNYSTIITESER